MDCDNTAVALLTDSYLDAFPQFSAAEHGVWWDSPLNPHDAAGAGGPYSPHPPAVASTFGLDRPASPSSQFAVLGDFDFRFAGLGAMNINLERQGS